MKIFFGVYNYFQQPVGYVAANKYNFYSTLLEGLKNAGHDVLCVDCTWEKNKNIPDALVSKLEMFDPDLCVIGNFGFWSIYDYVKCPICYFDIDSIEEISMATIYRIRNNLDRCFFVAHNEKMCQLVKEKFNADENQIITTDLFVRGCSEQTDIIGDIIYFGDNYVKRGYEFLSTLNSVADEKEKKEAEIVLKEYINNPEYSSQELYDKHKFYAYHRLDFSQKNKYLTDIIGLEKIKILSKLSNLDLTIKGYGWYSNAIFYYPELIKCAADANDFDVYLYSETLSKYKIALIFNDGPYCKGDNLRLLEAAASNACVVVQNSVFNSKLVNELGLISFDNMDEAYNICLELLKDDVRRRQHIQNAHQKIFQNYSVNSTVKAINNKFDLVGGCENVGKLEILEESDLISRPIAIVSTDFVKTSSVKTVDATGNEIFKPNSESKLKILAKKIIKRFALFFGYDLKNEFSKEALKVFGFLVYERLHYTETTDRIYVLSLPLFEIRKKNGTSHLHLAAFTQTVENIGKLFKFLNRKKKKNKAPIYARLRKKIKKGEKIKICLFVSRISCWIYTNLYKHLKNSDIFDPIIVVKPFMFNGHDAMIDYMNTTYDVLKARGYNVVKGYDEATCEFLDVRKAINPDIVFYTKYWKPQFQENFYIDKFEDKLTFYTSYCFDIAYHPQVMNFELNNKVDRYFMPTPIHKEMAAVAMDNHASNVYIVGAPKLDVFFDKTYIPQDVWKPQEKKKKRIIWAPHHSDNFPGNLYQFNAFYELTDFMFEMAEKYKDDIQIAFKPHPMLKPYLANSKWGKESADAYYDKWANLENGQLETGEFIDLFLTSDAMILDSISFIAEYTATNKPSLFTIGSTSRVRLNDFGAINFEVLYHTDNNLKEDIEKFIVDVVINGNDTKKEERTEFVNKYLLPPNGKSSAENIYDNILDEIQNGDKK